MPKKTGRKELRVRDYVMPCEYASKPSYINVEDGPHQSTPKEIGQRARKTARQKMLEANNKAGESWVERKMREA